MKIQAIHIVLLAAAILAIAPDGAGASPANRRYFRSSHKYSEINVWLEGLLGGGAFYETKETLFIYGGSVNFQYDILYCSLRITDASTVHLHSEPDPSLFEISPMVGIGFDSNEVSASLLIGFGYVSTISRGELEYSETKRRIVSTYQYDYYRRIDDTSYGVPCEIQVMVRINENVRMGLNFLGNLNPKETTAGVVFAAQVGAW